MNAHSAIPFESRTSSISETRLAEGSSLKRAFSLIEMLIVAAILILLLVLTAPVLSSVANGYALTDAGQRLSANIERARVHATTTQKVTMLRFFATPGETTQNGLTAFRLYEITLPPSASPAAAQTNSISQPTRLREPIFISWEKSSALQNSKIVATSGTLGESDSVPCLEMYFFPDGSTSLAAESPNPYFTLLTKHDVEDLNNPFVVSLDPRTSRTTIFRR